MMEMDEIDGYDDYITFIRRMMNDELKLNLSEDKLMNIYIDDIKDNGAKWSFICYLNKSLYVYEALSYHIYLKFIRRDKRVSNLLNKRK